MPSLYPYPIQVVLRHYPRCLQLFDLGYTLGTPWVKYVKYGAKLYKLERISKQFCLKRCFYLLIFAFCEQLLSLAFG